MNCPVCNKSNSSNSTIIKCDCGIEYCNSISTMTKEEIEEIEELKDNSYYKKKVFENRIEYYNRRGQLHRENDLPAIEYSNGTKKWYVNGKRHRDNDKPAIFYSKNEKSSHLKGRKEWYKEGKCHRDNGKPAIIYLGRNGKEIKIFYEEGKKIEK